jgi:hypothetical protein
VLEIHADNVTVLCTAGALVKRGPPSGAQWSVVLHFERDADRLALEKLLGRRLVSGPDGSCACPVGNLLRRSQVRTDVTRNAKLPPAVLPVRQGKWVDWSKVEPGALLELRSDSTTATVEARFARVDTKSGRLVFGGGQKDETPRQWPLEVWLDQRHVPVVKTGETDTLRAELSVNPDDLAGLDLSTTPVEGGWLRTIADWSRLPRNTVVELAFGDSPSTKCRLVNASCGEVEPVDGKSDDLQEFVREHGAMCGRKWYTPDAAYDMETWVECGAKMTLSALSSRRSP